MASGSTTSSHSSSSKGCAPSTATSTAATTPSSAAPQFSFGDARVQDYLNTLSQIHQLQEQQQDKSSAGQSSPSYSKFSSQYQEPSSSSASIQTQAAQPPSEGLRGVSYAHLDSCASLVHSFTRAANVVTAAASGAPSGTSSGSTTAYRQQPRYDSMASSSAACSPAHSGSNGGSLGLAAVAASGSSHQLPPAHPPAATQQQIASLGHSGRSSCSTGSVSITPAVEITTCHSPVDLSSKSKNNAISIYPGKIAHSTLNQLNTRYFS